MPGAGRASDRQGALGNKDARVDVFLVARQKRESRAKLECFRARQIKFNCDEVSAMAPCVAFLKARKLVGDGTAVFYLDKPADFEFKAGQFANFTLLDGTEADPKDNTHTLSFASAPHEKNLIIAMRLRDTAFKRTLNELPIGARVLVQGPYGNLTLQNNATRPAVFIAGGIGITPFRSMISQATETHRTNKIFLFYSVRRAEDAAFLDELEGMEELNPLFKCIATVTRPDLKKNGWHGETGHITRETLERWIGDLRAPIYYIAGPPTMVSGVRDMLNGAGVDDDDIRAEEFFGY
jgi:ferredoxin-NADP reductase